MIKECVRSELTEQQRLEIKEQETIDRIIKAINGFMGDYSAWLPVSNDYRRAYCDILAVIEKMRDGRR